MVTETQPVERIPLYLGSIAFGVLLAFLVGGVLHTSPSGPAGRALLAVFPFALAALVGVAKSATP